jgi:prepilin-type N-terminal cleavage/methylation domain-containing protein
MKKAFSLVELMIVVAILGILGAIALPHFQNHTTQAKETASRNNLHVLRASIELYTAQHDGAAPGVLNDQVAQWIFYAQLGSYTNAQGNATGTKSEAFPYGPYLPDFPENPFNNKATVRMLTDGESFPVEADGTYGWIYSHSTKEIRLDWPGNATQGIRYYDY